MEVTIKLNSNDAIMLLAIATNTLNRDVNLSEAVKDDEILKSILDSDIERLKNIISSIEKAVYINPPKRS